MFCPKISQAYWKTLKKMNRTRAMYMIQIFTGHASLQYHLHNMKIEDTPTCQFCEEDKETVEHFLTQCPFFATKRRQVFNTFEIKEPLSSLKHTDVMRFVNLTKRFANFQFDVG